MSDVLFAARRAGGGFFLLYKFFILWYNPFRRCRMSDPAFADFTDQALSLSYEQTLILMGRLLESLKRSVSNL
jgi:hypothetical protein